MEGREARRAGRGGMDHRGRGAARPRACSGSTERNICKFAGCPTVTWAGAQGKLRAWANPASSLPISHAGLVPVLRPAGGRMTLVRSGPWLADAMASRGSYMQHRLRTGEQDVKRRTLNVHASRETKYCLSLVLIAHIDLSR